MIPPNMTPQQFIDVLLASDREDDVDLFFILNNLPMEPYDHIADIGCGPGFFTIPLAKNLVYGRLYALDVIDEMLEVTRRRVEEARLANVEVLKCTQDQFPLSPRSLDGAFIAFVTHQNQDRLAFLRSVAELIKPRGWCVVLEWFNKETGQGPPLERRIDPSEMEKLARDAGFHSRGWRDLNGKQYMLSLRR